MCVHARACHMCVNRLQCVSAGVCVGVVVFNEIKIRHNETISCIIIVGLGKKILCTCVCVYSICVYVCTKMYVYMCVCVFPWEYMCVWMYVCMCVCVYVHVCVCVCVYVHVCMCICVYGCMCVCVYSICVYVCMCVQYVHT